MTPSKAAIKQFIANNANVYPYSEVKSTRNGYYCKWITLQSCGRNVDVLRVGDGYLYALPTACLDSGTLQHLMLSKEAHPLCNESSHIKDCMSMWGSSVSERWHQLVLNLLCGEKQSKKELFRLCIQIRVEDLINDRLLVQPELAPLVRLQWFIAFNNFFDYMTNNFFELYMRSFQFVQVKIKEATSYRSVTPLDSTSSLLEDDSVQCLPVVSSSSQ